MFSRFVPVLSTYSYCHIRVCGLLTSVLITLYMSLTHGWSQGQPPQQLTFLISAQEGSCDRSVALYHGERITLTFPDTIQVSVPSQDRLVKLFISGRLVVITPLAQSLPDKQTKTKFPAVSITTELVSGETFICQFEVLPRTYLLEGDKPINLIRIVSKEKKRRRENEAIQLIQMRLKHLERTQSDDQDLNSDYVHLDQLLNHWREQTSRYAIANVLGAPNLRLSSAIPLRTQKHLIYITIERVIISHHLAYLRVKLRNHSQTTFNLHRIVCLPPDGSKAVTLWTPSHLREGETLSALPNGQAQIMVLHAPVHLLRSKHLVFEGEGQRKVSVDLSSLSEL